MRSRSVSARDGGVVFVAVLLTAAYVYAILLAASPDRMPAPSLPDPWRLADTIGRVIVGLEPEERDQRAPVVGDGSVVPIGDAAVDERRPAAPEDGTAPRRELRNGEPAVPLPPLPSTGLPDTPTAPGARGQAKGHGKKGSQAHASARGQERRAATSGAKTSRGQAAHGSSPGRGRSLGPAHSRATERSGRARAKTPPQRARGHAKRPQRHRR